MLAVKRQSLQSQPYPAHLIKSTGFLSSMPQNTPESFTPHVLGRASSQRGCASAIRHLWPFYLTLSYGLRFLRLFSKCSWVCNIWFTEIQHNIPGLTYLCWKGAFSVLIMVTGPRNLTALSSVQKAKVIETTCVMRKYNHNKKYPISKKYRATVDSLKSVESDSLNLTGTFASVLSVINRYFCLCWWLVPAQLWGKMCNMYVCR